MSNALQLSERATQVRFAAIVGVTQPAISEKVASGVLRDGGTYGEWLLAYCERLRLEAAGRGGDDQVSLTRARTREAEASAELKLLQIKEKAGELVPMSTVEQMFTAMVTAARQELLTLPDLLANDMRALYGAEVDAGLIEERVHAALEHLADGVREDGGVDDAPGTPRMGAASKAVDD